MQSPKQPFHNYHFFLSNVVYVQKYEQKFKDLFSNLIQNHVGVGKVYKMP